MQDSVSLETCLGTTGKMMKLLSVLEGSFSYENYTEKVHKEKNCIIRTSHSSFTTANFTLKKCVIFLLTEHHKNYAYENSWSAGII
jgi:hypothetical protein